MFVRLSFLSPLSTPRGDTRVCPTRTPLASLSSNSLILCLTDTHFTPLTLSFSRSRRRAAQVVQRKQKEAFRRLLTVPLVASAVAVLVSCIAQVSAPLPSAHGSRDVDESESVTARACSAPNVHATSRHRPSCRQCS